MTSTFMLRAAAQGDQVLTFRKPKVETKNVTIRLTVGNRTLKKEVPIWNAPSAGRNLEPFCESYNEFLNAMDEFNLTQNAAQCFNAWRQMLGGTTRSAWNSISEDERGNADNNNGAQLVAFDASIARLVQQVAGPNPRDKASNYLRRPENVMKRQKDSVWEHGARLELLFKYHDLLPGNTPLLSEPNDPEQICQRKDILFQSFPLTWQQNFRINRAYDHNQPNISWQDILEYMATQKSVVDFKQAREQAHHQTNRRDRGRRSRGKTNSQNARGGRGHQYSNPQYRPYPNNFQGNNGNQGNYQVNYQNRYPPRYNNYNGGHNRPQQGQAGRNQVNNCNQRGGRGFQARGAPPPVQQRNNQNYYAESHFMQEEQRAVSSPPQGSVPGGNGGMPGGMPYDQQAEEQHFYEVDGSENGPPSESYYHNDSYSPPPNDPHYDSDAPEPEIGHGY